MSIKLSKIYFFFHKTNLTNNCKLFQRTMRELLLKEDANVVVVSWIGGAGPPYTQAVANTRLVGAMTGRLASQLIQKGNVSPNRMHCIGHSLGAHTCGYVGSNLRVQYGYKLGRITGVTLWLINLFFWHLISYRDFSKDIQSFRMLKRINFMGILNVIVTQNNRVDHYEFVLIHND